MWSAGSGRAAGPALLGVLLALSLSGGRAAKTDAGLVTCGSVLKLFNTQHRVRLHSHDIKYGSGSGQQSVTGVEASDDANSYWRIRGGTEGECPRGSPVRCGQAVRLTHVLTGKNLHTHHFPSPLTNNQIGTPHAQLAPNPEALTELQKILQGKITTEDCRLQTSEKASWKKSHILSCQRVET
nr:stromal cell-derived factor 2-like protein 1 isoform X2 [Bubalus bubalis]